MVDDSKIFQLPDLPYSHVERCFDSATASTMKCRSVDYEGR